MVFDSIPEANRINVLPDQPFLHDPIPHKDKVLRQPKTVTLHFAPKGCKVGEDEFRSLENDGVHESGWHDGSLHAHHPVQVIFADFDIYRLPSVGIAYPPQPVIQFFRKAACQFMARTLWNQKAGVI